MMLPLLIESALRSLAVAIVVWLAITALRIRNPHVQHTSWLVITVAALLMPLLMKIGTIKLPTESIFAGSIFDDLGIPQLAAVTATSTDSLNVLTGIYMVVCGLLLTRLLIGVVQTWRLSRNAQRVNKSWAKDYDVRATAAIRSPVTFASIILLPSEGTNWDAVKVDAVLAHEGSHVRNFDFYVQLLAQLHRAIFWFSPLSWWLPKRISDLSEMISDDAAVERVVDRAAYANVLLEFARDAHRSPFQAPSSIGMARLSTVGVRIERILSESRRFASLGRRARIGIALCLVPLVVVAANGSPQKDDQPIPPSIAKQTTKSVVMPKVDPTIGLTLPAYPAEEKRSDHTGTVYLNVLIGASGNVLDVKIKSSAGYDALDQAAVNEARNWQLIAGTENGVNVPMWVTIPVVFKLKTNEAPAENSESNSAREAPIT